MQLTSVWQLQHLKMILPVLGASFILLTPIFREPIPRRGEALLELEFLES